MFRKYVIITLAAVLSMSIASCTSQKAEDDADIQADIDSESAETADATEDNGDLSTSDTEEPSEESTEVADGELAPDEQLPADDGGDKIADNSEVTSDDLAEEPAADELADNSQEQVASTDTLPPAEPAAEPAPAETTTAAVPEPTPAETAMAATPEPEAESAKPLATSLKKVASQPWKVGKALANAVYIVRDGDTADSISQKVFGSTDKVKHLCRVNSFNCNRGLKVGDKMYYTSPQRPEDDTTVKTFYEDANIAPQVYTAKAGDNIRKVGQELLGHERSWMELWATNDVESKGDLDEGTQLRYWPATEVAVPVQTMASNETPTSEGSNQPASDMTATPAGDMAQQAPQGQDMAAVGDTAPPVAADPNASAAPDQAAVPTPPVGDQAAPPVQDVGATPPDQQTASNDLPPPPDQGAAAGTVEPPPPPPVEEPKTADASAVSVDSGDPDQTMILGVGAILFLAMAALFISIRKKRQRRAIDFNTSTQTQID